MQEISEKIYQLNKNSDTCATEEYLQNQGFESQRDTECYCGTDYYIWTKQEFPNFRIEQDCCGWFEPQYYYKLAEIGLFDESLEAQTKALTPLGFELSVEQFCECGTCDPERGWCKWISWNEDIDVVDDKAFRAVEKAQESLA